MPWSPVFVGNTEDLVHTFSNFDVDVLSSFELRKGGDCAVLFQSPVEKVLVAMGKVFIVDLASEGKVSRLKSDL